jgi:hypothetical protein
VRPTSIFLYPTEIGPVGLWAHCTQPNSGPPGSSSSSGQWPSRCPHLASPLRPPPMDALLHQYGAEPTCHRLLFNFPMIHRCPVISSSSNRCLDSAPPAAASPTVSPPLHRLPALYKAVMPRLFAPQHFAPSNSASQHLHVLYTELHRRHFSLSTAGLSSPSHQPVKPIVRLPIIPSRFPPLTVSFRALQRLRALTPRWTGRP